MKLLIIIGLFVLILLVASLLERRRLRRIAAERKEESICTFARALDYRNLDTGIIRMVYEELQDYLGTSVPLRPGDALQEDLHIDREDLGDMAIELLKRCRRGFDDVPSNPFAQVRTVGDLIRFLHAQPSTTTQRGACT